MALADRMHGKERGMMLNEEQTNLGRRPFRARLEGNTLVLDGALDASIQVEHELSRAFRLASSRHRLNIEAAASGVLRGGVDAWIRCVHEYLKNNELRYRSSQLEMLLSVDDEYRAVHPHSTFDDEE